MASLQQYFILFIISNAIICLNADYEGYPPKSGHPLQCALKRSIELKCRYHGIDSSGEFLEWFREIDGQTVSVNAELQGHYVVKHTDKESTLNIRIFVESDARVTKWFVKTSNLADEHPLECQFGSISIIPSPQGIMDNHNQVFDSPHASTRRTEGEVLNFKCLIEPETLSLVSQIKWEFSPDNKAYGDVPTDAQIKGDELHIEPIEKMHRGYYRCSLNKVDFTLLLRVKDRLAALWPFLGIVGIVLVLVLIIIIYEKRQQSNKKSSSNDDDEQDRPSDPLVRTTVKSSNNDNKKRAIKA